MLRSRGRIRAVLLVAVSGVAGVGACAPPAPSNLPAGTVAAILGGTADTTPDAVMALLQSTGAQSAYECSGTTVARIGTSAFLLTAAHCVVPHDAMGNVVLPVSIVAPSVMTVLPGPDFQTSLTQAHTYGVAQISVAPGYDGAADSPNDLAIVRYLTYASTVPMIPILEPADDALAVGSLLTLVGYGRTEAGGQNSVRRTVDRPVDSVTPQHLTYLQNDGKGQCNGDSGGPPSRRPRAASTSPA